MTAIKHRAFLCARVFVRSVRDSRLNTFAYAKNTDIISIPRPSSEWIVLRSERVGRIGCKHLWTAYCSPLLSKGARSMSISERATPKSSFFQKEPSNQKRDDITSTRRRGAPVRDPRGHGDSGKSLGENQDNFEPHGKQDAAQANSPTRAKESVHQVRNSEGTIHWRPQSDKESETQLCAVSKIIARSGLCSRRRAEEMAAEGRVQVNGEVVRGLAMKVRG
jgi:hypothetical protein